MNILMPQLGETVAEGKITKWFKAAGDTVQAGRQPVRDRDRQGVDGGAGDGGRRLERNPRAEGEVAPVGAIVGVIGSGGRRRDAHQRAARAPSRQPGHRPHIALLHPPRLQRPIKLDPFFEVRTPERNFGPARLSGGVTVTPLARRLASEAGIDLSRLRGSGPHGRIVARDVENAPRPAAPRAPLAAMAEGSNRRSGQGALRPGKLRGSAARRHAQDHRGAAASGQADYPAFLPHRRHRDRSSNKRCARRRTPTRPTPSFILPACGEGREGAAFKLSLNDFIIRALALALQRVPAANAVWAGDRILRFKHSDVGVAVALDGGLITPMIRAAETKSVSAISTEMKDLAARAIHRSDLASGSIPP